MATGLDLEAVRQVISTKELLDSLGISPDYTSQSGKTIKYRNPTRTDNNPSCIPLKKGLYDQALHELYGYTELVHIYTDLPIDKCYDYLAELAGLDTKAASSVDARMQRPQRFPITEEEIKLLSIDKLPAKIIYQRRFDDNIDAILKDMREHGYISGLGVSLIKDLWVEDRLTVWEYIDSAIKSRVKITLTDKGEKLERSQESKVERLLRDMWKNHEYSKVWDCIYAAVDKKRKEYKSFSYKKFKVQVLECLGNYLQNERNIPDANKELLDAINHQEQMVENIYHRYLKFKNSR